MQKSLDEIAGLVGGAVEGDGSVVITGVAGIKDAAQGQITFVANPKYLPMLEMTEASAVIVGPDVPACDKNLIRTDNPYLTFTEVLKLFAIEPPSTPKGIHPSSTIGARVFFGMDVTLRAGVVIEDDCKIGDRSVLYPGVFVGSGTEIGADCIIYPRVIVSRNTLMGDKVIVHSGAVIGSLPRGKHDYFAGGSEEALECRVIIEDEVEIGASVTIDSARSGATIIGKGTKIDNLVHVGADSAVGRNCIIVSQASVGAKCKIGDGVTMAGQAGVMDGLSVGDGTIIAARAGVTENIDPNQIVSGFPAFSHEKWLRVCGSLKRLPTVVKDVREFKKRFDEMENSVDAEPKND